MNDNNIDIPLEFVYIVSTEYFKDFLISYECLRRNYNYKTLIIDVGLNPDETATVLGLDNTELICYDSPPHPIFEDQRNTILWAKPFLLRAIKRNVNLVYIDCDVFIIDNIEDVITAASQRFIIFTDRHGPTACVNNDRLYKNRGVSLASKKEGLAINAGFFAINPIRDEALLDEWCKIISEAHAELHLRELLSFNDQGALLYVIHKHKLYYNVIDDDTINVRPKRVFLDGIDDHKKDVYDALRDQNFGRRVIHFAGTPKYTNIKHDSSDFVSLASAYMRDMQLKPKKVLITGLDRLFVDTLAAAMVCSGPDTITHVALDSFKLEKDAFYRHNMDMTSEYVFNDLENYYNIIKRSGAALSIISGVNLRHSLKEACAIEGIIPIFIIPSLHRYISGSLENNDVYGDSLNNYSDQYLEQYRKSGCIERNLFKIYDKECEHIFTNYINEYANYIRLFESVNPEAMVVVDDHKHLMKMPALFDLSKHLDISTFNKYIQDNKAKSTSKSHKNIASKEFFLQMNTFKLDITNESEYKMPLYKLI